MTVLTLHHIKTSLGPATIQGTPDGGVSITVKPSIWPKVELLFSANEAEAMHVALGVAIFQAKHCHDHS